MSEPTLISKTAFKTIDFNQQDYESTSLKDPYREINIYANYVKDSDIIKDVGLIVDHYLENLDLEDRKMISFEIIKRNISRKNTAEDLLSDIAYIVRRVTNDQSFSNDNLEVMSREIRQKIGSRI